MRGVGQLDTGGNSGRVQRRRGEVHVQRLGSVELGDRQRPDQIVEVDAGRAVRLAEDP